MYRFFTFLQTYRSGIFFLLVCLFCIAFLVQWFAWIFRKGRFRSDSANGKDGVGSRAELRFVFSEAIVKIINDFRHLLALVIVLIFAFALGYSLIRAGSLQTGTDATSVINNMKEALQAVVATLGGLVGSIIGYYFGESSVAKASEPRPPTPPPDAEPITLAKAPSLEDAKPTDQ